MLELPVFYDHPLTEASEFSDFWERKCKTWRNFNKDLDHFLQVNPVGFNKVNPNHNNSKAMPAT